MSVPLLSKVTHPSGLVAPGPVSGLASGVSQVCEGSNSVHPGRGIVDQVSVLVCQNLLPDIVGSGGIDHASCPASGLSLQSSSGGSALTSGSASATASDLEASVQGSQACSALGVISSGVAEVSVIPQQHITSGAGTQQVVAAEGVVEPSRKS